MISLLRYSPLTKRALAEAAGCSTRDVELAIHQARLDGFPVISDSDGYRLSNDPIEVRACADRLMARLVNQAKTVRSLRRTARRMAAAQIELPWSVAA